MDDSIQILGTGYVAMGRNEPCEMEFSDGIHMVPPAVVQHLGGVELLLENRTMFKDKTYQNFIEGFWKLIATSREQEALQSIINTHLMIYGIRE